MLLILGLAMLCFGGEAMIRGAMGTASWLKISPLMCGIVIVGFGTSAPELVVSVNAIIDNEPDVALGNVVGSNIGNILLILGLCALIRPMQVSASALGKDMFGLIFVTLLCCTLISTGLFTFISGIVSILGLLGYLLWTYLTETSVVTPSANLHVSESKVVAGKTLPLWANTGLLALGLALLIAGANLFMQEAVNVAQQLGVSSAVIGLTLVAVGTSLPEITISIMATIRNNNDVAVGNVVGSNIFNILGILGITSIISPIPVSQRLIAFDQAFLAGSVVWLALLIFWRKRITRLSGLLLLGTYIAYLWWGTLQFNV